MNMTKGTPASSQIIWLEDRVKELEQQLELNRAEVAEQCRLNAMGAEREAKLMAEVAAWQKKADAVARAFNGLHEQLEACREDAERNALERAAKVADLNNCTMLAGMIRALTKEGGK